MRVLIIVPKQDRISGNWVTAQRFQQGLEAKGHRVKLYGTALKIEGRLRQQLLEFSPHVCILLHAYRSGQPWLEEAKGLNIPYLAMLTGTDVNQGLSDQKQKATIRKVLQHAAYVILQNPLILNDLRTIYPELTKNLRLLSPGIVLGEAPYALREVHDLPLKPCLFLCPAGLRPVKGILHLLQMFDLVARHNPDFSLAFCGPILDKSYSQSFFTALKSRPWAYYLGAIPTQAMANAMRGADIILNNSINEGLPHSLLEAATLGIPILAHHIPGNAAVVKHNVNGLMFRDETEFIQCALQLLDAGRRVQLTDPDPNLYDPTKEAAELINLLEKALML